MEHNTIGTPPSGSIRFNTDSAKMEIYNGDKWWEIDSTSPQERTGSTRGFIIGGYQNSPVSAYAPISYINIDTTGNAISFGNLVAAGNRNAAGASRTRAVFFRANAPAKNTIEYITMASTGNALDFGDMSTEHDSQGGCSDATRAMIAGGYSNPGSGPYARVNTIQYVTIASLGNAQDFGDMNQAQSDVGGAASPTRGLFMGGATSPSAPARNNHIEYITMASTGNGADFGDLALARSHCDGGSNAIRAICVGGLNTSSATVNTMDYVQIPTLGNAIDFGDMTVSVYARATSTSPTRLVNCAGGSPSSPYNTNVCDYVQIASTGNAIDFGDTVEAGGSEGPTGCSNGHGGLG